MSCCNRLTVFCMCIFSYYCIIVIIVIIIIVVVIIIVVIVVIVVRFFRFNYFIRSSADCDKCTAVVRRHFQNIAPFVFFCFYDLSCHCIAFGKIERKSVATVFGVIIHLKFKSHDHRIFFKTIESTVNETNLF